MWIDCYAWNALDVLAAQTCDVGPQRALHFVTPAKHDLGAPCPRECEEGDEGGNSQGNPAAGEDF